MSEEQLTYTQLFAGIGSFSLALDRAGCRAVGHCEIDPKARSVLARHWPGTPQHEDVATLRASTFEHPHIVTFGSPCQDLSIAGKRAGLAGERSGLFHEAVRYIREVQEATDGALPVAAVWENVPGAFSSNGGADFAAVLAGLVDGEIPVPDGGWGYAGVAFGPLGSAEWRVLDSQHFGVAQRRRRVFVVYRPGGERAGEVLLEPQGVRGDLAEGGEAGSGDAAGVARGLVAGGGELDGVARSVTTGTGRRYDGDTETLVPIAFRERGRPEGRTLELQEDLAYSLTAPSGGGRADERTLAAPIAFDMAQITSPHNRNRAEPGLPVPPLAASVFSSPHVANHYAVRRLTPTECERLQAFPDGWTGTDDQGNEVADTHRYRMLGNSTTVSVAEWICSRLVQVLRAEGAA